MFLFNVRVYGILVNQAQEVLVSDEKTPHASFTKFPGGGLEYGEGLIDALKREFWEECRLDIGVIGHVYTTDFYEKSSFNESQIISVYYHVEARGPFTFGCKKTPFDFSGEKYRDKMEVFRFVPVRELRDRDLTFRTDKVAWKTFKNLKI